jgi:hypothetical protein
MVQTAYITSTTSSITLDTSFDTYIINASGGNITIILPSIVADGMVFNLVRTDQSGNIVTINTSSSQLINGVSSITINSSSEMCVRSISSEWRATFGGGVGRVGESYRITVIANNGNNFLSFGSTQLAYTAIASFIFRGSDFHGGIPSLWKIIYSSSGNSSTFLLRLRDITTQSNLCTKTISWNGSGSGNQTIDTSTTFSNVGSNETIWQLEIQRQNGSGQLNFYASYLDF